MSRNVTVGLVQMDCELMNKKANLEKMLGYVKEAAEKTGVTIKKAENIL